MQKPFCMLSRYVEGYPLILLSQFLGDPSFTKCSLNFSFNNNKNYFNVPWSSKFQVMWTIVLIRLMPGTQNEDQHHSDKDEMQLTNIIVTSTPCIPPVSIEICSVTWRWIRHHLIVWIISDWASILPPHPELKQRLD